MRTTTLSTLLEEGEANERSVPWYCPRYHKRLCRLRHKIDCGCSAWDSLGCQSWLVRKILDEGTKVLRAKSIEISIEASKVVDLVTY